MGDLPWTVLTSRRLNRPTLRPSMVWMRRVSCRRPTSRPSMRDLGRRLRRSTSKVMDVYNAMAGVVGSSPVPNYLYSQVNPQDAQAAYNALLEFKDVVKAAQR